MRWILYSRKESLRARARQDQSRKAAAQLHSLLLKYKWLWVSAEENTGKGSTLWWFCFWFLQAGLASYLEVFLVWDKSDVFTQQTVYILKVQNLHTYQLLSSSRHEQGCLRRRGGDLQNPEQEKCSRRIKQSMSSEGPGGLWWSWWTNQHDNKDSTLKAVMFMIFLTIRNYISL